MTPTPELLDEQTEKLIENCLTATDESKLRTRIRELLEEARKEERERCAKIAEGLNSALIPDEIRRGNERI